MTNYRGKWQLAGNCYLRLVMSSVTFMTFRCRLPGLDPLTPQYTPSTLLLFSLIPTLSGVPGLPATGIGH